MSFRLRFVLPDWVLRDGARSREPQPSIFTILWVFFFVCHGDGLFQVSGVRFPRDEASAEGGANKGLCAGDMLYGAYLFGGAYQNHAGVAC